MLQKLLKELKETSTTLVAVSKTKPNEQILELYHKGHKIFGENRVQELVLKEESLPKDIEWHMIGHLQSKKVKSIASFVAMIHSVESLKLLKEIDKQAIKFERVIPVLLQFKIAEEFTKYGLTIEGAQELLESADYKALKNVKIGGVMGMATYTDDENQVRSEFKNLKNIFDQLKEKYFAEDPTFKEISMGMSGDYKIAIEEGSTMVRIGSLIFGART